MSKIKTFKEFIKESVWADLHSRGIGKTEREEDDINALDADGFYHYIKDHYSFNNGALTMGNPGGPFIIAAPVVNSGRFMVHYLILWSDSVRFEISNSIKSNVEFIVLLEKEYTVKPMELVANPTLEYINILPKDGSEVTNRFFIEVLDFFIANIEKHAQGEYLNVEKIQVNESVWGDLHSRGIGETEREEDDVNLLDENDFEKYLQDHYNVTNGYSIYSLGDIIIPVLKPSITDRNFSLMYDGMYQDGIDISDDLQDYYPQLYKKLQKEFVLSHRGSMFNITPKSGEKCTNKFCIEVLDFIINNAKKDLIIEKR